MSTTIVWLMIILNAHGSIWSTGPEFTSWEKCEVAAQVVYKTVDSQVRLGVKKPICIKIEK